MRRLKVFAGPTSAPFATAVCNYLGAALGKMSWERFADGERCPQFEENVRGAHAFLIQSTHQPDENLVNLLMMLDAAKRASVKHITAVVPYFGYGRQEEKSAPRVPITAKLVAVLMAAAGGPNFKRVLTMDLHCGAIQGFFEVPVDHLYAKPLFIKKINEICGDEIDSNLWTMLAPDEGALDMNRSYAEKLGGLSVAVVDKRRFAANASKVMRIVGDVKGKHVWIVDDMIDTGGTLVGAAEQVMEMGALSVRACCTHAVLSNNAIKRIEDSPILQIFVTDTIRPVTEKIFNNHGGKTRVLTAAKLFAEAIKNIYEETSVSTLFV